MKKLAIYTAMLSLIVSFASAGLQAQSEGEKKQLTEELEKREKALQAQVLEVNERLGAYAVLNDWELHYSPAQTRVKKSDEYVELETYAFIPHFPGSTILVGKKSRIMRLYFSGESVSKVESIVEELNFETHTRTYTVIVDPSPTSEDTSDITVEHVETGDFAILKPLESPLAYKTTLGEMANTVSQPLRIRFLRDFYVNHINALETLFAATKGLQERFGTNNDVAIIKSLRKAMKVH